MSFKTTVEDPGQFGSVQMPQLAGSSHLRRLSGVSDVVVASDGNSCLLYFCDVLLKAQLTVKVYAEISNNFPWLDDVATDSKQRSEPEILLRLAQLPNQAISVFAAFNWSL